MIGRVRQALSSKAPASERRRSLRDVRAMFESVVDKDGVERARQLDRVCLGLPELRRELEALLAAADRTPAPGAEEKRTVRSIDPSLLDPPSLPEKTITDGTAPRAAESMAAATRACSSAWLAGS